MVESPLSPHPLCSSLNGEDRLFIEAMVEKYRLSFQQTRLLIESAIDLALWQMGPLSNYFNESIAPNLRGKPRSKALIENLTETLNRIRREPTDYEDFTLQPISGVKALRFETTEDLQLLGRCPCPVSGEKTRCCNLATLDAVRQCGFGCSYCSIQAFYHENEILFSENLERELSTLEIPEEVWHIGTGQSSDSLMWGNKGGMLDALASFAKKNPSIVVELKTKSARSDWIKEVTLPSNVVATWSLNGPTIIEKEEWGTDSLNKRLQTAQKAAQANIPIGFHFHPMVYYKGWQEEYAAVIETLCTLFSPSQVMMISFGTLTFTKANLRTLRESARPSRILQMELHECAGKYSYPIEIKKELFSFAYNCFPPSWREENGPFFYLCMELPQLWEPTLGRAYVDNASFEADMKRAYYRFLNISEVDKRVSTVNN